MRPLNTADVFKAARAVKSSGLREELKKLTLCIANGSGEVDVENIGVDAILQVIECFADKNAEKAIYEVLSGPFEMDADMIPVMTLDELFGCLEYMAMDPGLKYFFKRVSGLIGAN